jgi:glycosyltransferase involved in cell wall biosynthesis
VFVAPSAYPLGGVADWLDYLLPGLEQFGWRCVLALASGRFHDVETYVRRHPWHDVAPLKNPTGSHQGRVNAIQSLLQRLKPDVAVSVNIASVYPAARSMRSSGLESPRIVMSLHGLQADLLADVASARDVIDAVIATNKLAVRLAQGKLQSTDRVHYAGYGVPSRQPMTNESTCWGPGGPMRLLYAGRLEQEQKRVLDLVVLARKLHDRGRSFEICIAGGGPLESELRAAAASAGLDQCFRFLGVLDPASLSRAYSEHHALIITSTWETGPIVAWEAMSHGLPVVSSRYVGSGLEAALIDSENCMLFPIGDMGAAADALAALEEETLRQRVIKGGHRLVASRYSRMLSVQQWNDAMRKVVGSPPLIAAPTIDAFSPVGRLDRVFGIQRGEALRARLQLKYQHTTPGGEWPHSHHGTSHGEDAVFWAAATREDSQ